MEVPHHPDVEKKNFKEYLLEFIMIFLAVTMGFFKNIGCSNYCIISILILLSANCNLSLTNAQT